MIRISKIFVVDGEEINVSAEGGSAKEALAIVEQEAETLGPAPRAGNGGIAKTRARRTKAELEAARAAQEAAVTASHNPTTEPTRVFQPTTEPAFHSGIPTTGIPSGPASFAPGAPAPQEAKSVAFEGGPPVDAPSPPPPPDSEEDTLREKINAVMKETIDLHPAWRDAVIAAMHRAAEKHGGDIFRMAAEPLRDVLKGVEEYQRKVREALASGQRR